MKGDEDEEENALAGFIETLVELETGKDNMKPVQLFRWIKEKGKYGQRDQCVRANEVNPLSEAAKMMATDFESLVVHLKRNKEIKTLIKEKRMEVLDTEGVAMIHIDWAENMVIKVTVTIFK